MRFSDNAMSAILLCSYIGIKSDDVLKPLSLKEWNEFLDKAMQYGQQPAVVMNQDQTFLKEIGCSQEYIERIKKLMFRGGVAAFELDDLERKGIDIVTIFDSDYPVLLKRRLKKKAPPVLFYSGDIDLAKKVGIGIVGSRNVEEEGIQFARKLVEKAAKERLVIYSGGAKGVDSVSENAAIEFGSAAVSFVADALVSKIRKKDVFDSILSRQRLLISDVKPNMGFTKARAMNRNKYIYASSYGTFVVSSDYDKGGTWSGAIEAVRNGWTKVFVWNHKEYEGNCKLIEKGGISYELSETPILEVIMKKEEEFRQMDLFSFAKGRTENKEDTEQEAENRIRETESQKEEKKLSENQEESEGQRKENPMLQEARTEEHRKERETGYQIEQEAEGVGERETMDLYYVIGPEVIKHIGEGMTNEEAAAAFGVAKGQMRDWLKRLCRDSRLKYVKGRYVRI